MLASFNGNAAVVKLLIEKGARCDIVNNDGNTALTFANYNGYPIVASLLMAKSNKRILDETATTAKILTPLKKPHLSHSVYQKHYGTGVSTFPDFFYPIFLGKWKYLDGIEAEYTLQQLLGICNKLSFIKTRLIGIRTLAPVFYPAGKFVEFLYYSSDGTRYNSVNCKREKIKIDKEAEKYKSTLLMLTKNEVYFFDGSIGDIYTCNRAGYLKLNYKTVFDYLQFFNTYVVWGNSNFRIFSTIDDVQLCASLDDFSRSVVIDSLKNLKILQDKDGGFSIKNCVTLHNQSFSCSDYSVSHDGIVTSICGTQLVSGLPVKVETLDDQYRCFRDNWLPE